MFRSGLDCVSLSEGTYSGFLICSDLRKWQIQIKETKRATFSPILLMEEILHHLGLKATVWIKGKPPINWCRISSININSMDESGTNLRLLSSEQSSRKTQKTPKQPRNNPSQWHYLLLVAMPFNHCLICIIIYFPLDDGKGYLVLVSGINIRHTPPGDKNPNLPNGRLRILIHPQLGERKPSIRCLTTSRDAATSASLRTPGLE